MQAERREAEMLRRERVDAARLGQINYNTRCTFELQGRRCCKKNAKSNRCKYRFHAPKGYDGGNWGPQPTYMRKDKDDFGEDEDEFEDWDKAAWEAFICKPCAP